ncbi:MAG: methylmalonyl-CoA mutase subunit beta [Actinomycetota bacterium]|nr:methylmalonyl-CoA mutase subunit beta [Actinomycetota bacterium]
MPAASEPLALAGEFPVATREQWRELVSEVLRRSGTTGSGTSTATGSRGSASAAVSDPEQALSSRSYDGIDIKPLYTAEDALSLAHDGVPGHPPFVRGATAETAARTGWDVRQRHADPDAARTNAAALTDLTNGATSLWLVAGNEGVPVSELEVALAGIHLDLAPVALDAGARTREAAAGLLAIVTERGIAAGEFTGTLGADPIGCRARTGAPADLALLAGIAADAAAFARLCLATVDATVYHDAGASDSDEVGVSASVGVAYLRALTDGGLSIDEALGRLEFRYAVNADQFLSIAKLRAARRVWDRIAELSGASPSRRGQRQHAVTSAAMMTRRDPWVNMLRSTIGCFAAAIGGADAITVLPFDSALGLPDDFARRIARNTQAILHDEASLARVIDAAGGSWYVETLTDQLAEKAWSTFTMIERAGGALHALEDGTIDAVISAARSARAADIAHRRAPITGVSEFAHIDERPLRREPAPPAATGGLLQPIRYAQGYEALRDRSEAAGTRPRVFLAALGPPSASSPRVSFASNLFQAAGIEAVAGSGTPDDVVAEFQASGTNVVCLCSSERVYADTAGWVAKALREAGAEFVWLAGKPGEREESERASGIDGYVFSGCDALAALSRTLDVLGVA